MKTTQWIAAYESAKGTADAKKWEWHKELLGHLKADGMSSDESDKENDQIVYRVKEYEWRNPDIVPCMESIDKQRLRVPAFKRKGTKPARRSRNGPSSDHSDPEDAAEEIRGGNLISNRPHVDGLPKACYNEKWMAKPENKVLLNVSEESFNWIRRNEESGR
jgi:hypothetical protein